MIILTYNEINYLAVIRPSAEPNEEDHGSRFR